MAMNSGCNTLTENVNFHIEYRSQCGFQSTVSYRFGFNGQEADNEIKGTGNSIEFKFRIYDSRLGKFLSVDPIASGFPFYCPYSFAGNTPIMAFDFEGLQPVKRIFTKNKVKRTFTYKNVIYTFKSNIYTPQKFSIESGNVKTKFSFKSEYGKRISLQLLRNNRCAELEQNQDIENSSDDRTLDVQKMNNATHNNINLFELVVAMMKENQDIEFVIIGNHAIHKTRSDMFFSGDSIYDQHDPINPRTDKTECDFCQIRADFIKAQYFFSSNEVTTYSRYVLYSNKFPNILLTPWQKDPVGITISFDFTKLINPKEKYKNVRFL